MNQKQTIEPELTDTRAMDLIALHLGRGEWDSDTISDIADIVLMTGREIGDTEAGNNEWGSDTTDEIANILQQTDRECHELDEGDDEESEIEQQPVCPYCKSTDVSVDAAARWSVEENDWVLSGVHDGGGCEACQTEIKHFDWKDL